MSASVSPSLDRRLWLAEHRVPLVCLLLAVGFTVLSGINPVSRLVWLAETVPVAVAIPVMALTYGRFRFSDGVYVQVALLIALHDVGSHFTYGQVPITEWLREGFQRNPYDRVVHFAFGLLLFQGVHELLFRNEPRRRLRGELLFVFSALVMVGAMYEIFEWVTSGTISNRAGVKYMGSQGDIWDAQKDLLADALGAGVGALFVGLREWIVRRSKFLPGGNLAGHANAHDDHAAAGGLRDPGHV